MNVLNWTGTNYLQPQYSTSSSGYSVTEFEAGFAAAEHVRADSITPELFGETVQVVFTVIDGELCLVKDEAPPGARLPGAQLFSRLLEFADALAPTEPAA
jgi:hypothetical protein